MTIDTILDNLNHAGYLATKEIGYALLGATDSSVPLLVEGEPGVGKSALAVAAAKAFNIPLIRLQCYDGITPDTVLYDYNYQMQLLVVSAIRDKLNAEMQDMSIEQCTRYVSENVEFYGERFLLRRPVFSALTMPGRKILLIDEIDKASEEIENALLEVLSDFSISIPEYGTITCAPENRPIVILTSNRYRTLSEPLKRRCAYLYIRRKTRAEIEMILSLHIEGNSEFTARIAKYLDQINELKLQHPVSISEGIDWAKFILEHFDDTSDASIRQNIDYTAAYLGKTEADVKKIIASVKTRGVA